VHITGCLCTLTCTFPMFAAGPLRVLHALVVYVSVFATPLTCYSIQNTHIEWVPFLTYTAPRSSITHCLSLCLSLYLSFVLSLFL